MINRFLNHIEEWIIATLMASATVVIFLAVLHRFLSGVPYIQDYAVKLHVSWAQELCIFMFVWMAKFGAAYGVRTGIHVGVDVILRKLTGKSKTALVLFGLLAGATFTVIVGALGSNFVWEMSHTDQTSSDLELPMWIAYLCLPLGSFLMSFRFLQVAVSFFKTGELPHHDHGHVEGLEDVYANDLVAGTPSEAGARK